MSDLEAFFKGLDPDRRQLAESLRELVTSSFPELEEIYSWKMPVYVLGKAKIVYIQKGKAGINFGFNNGAMLDEPQGLFQGGGKQMRHLAIVETSDIDVAYLEKLISEAIANEES